MIKSLMHSPIDLQLVEKHYQIKITPTIKFKLDALKNKDLIGLEIKQHIATFNCTKLCFEYNKTKKIVFNELKQAYLDDYKKKHRLK